MSYNERHESQRGAQKQKIANSCFGIRSPCNCFTNFLYNSFTNCTLVFVLTSGTELTHIKYLIIWLFLSCMSHVELYALVFIDILSSCLNVSIGQELEYICLLSLTCNVDKGMDSQGIHI